MNELLVEDYVDSKKAYLFDAEKSVLRPALDDDKSKAHGYYSSCLVGLFSRRAIQVIVFTAKGELKCSLDGRLYNLTDDNITATVRTVFLTRFFCLKEKEEEKIRLRYWPNEYGEGPGDGDIFSYLESVTSSPENRRSAKVLLESGFRTGCVPDKGILDKIGRIRS